MRKKSTDEPGRRPQHRAISKNMGNAQYDEAQRSREPIQQGAHTRHRASAVHFSYTSSSQSEHRDEAEIHSSIVLSQSSSLSSAESPTSVWSLDDVRALQYPQLTSESIARLESYHRQNERRWREIKRQRLRRKRLITIVSVVTGIILLALIGLMGLHWYRVQQDNTYAHAQLDEQIAHLQSTDQVVVAVDEAIDDEVSADRIDYLSGLISSIPGTKETLLSIAGAIEGFHDLFSDEEGRYIAEAVAESADARSEMLNYGKRLLQNDVNALNAFSELSDALKLIVAADSAVRDSIDASSMRLNGGMEKSLSLSQDALSYLGKANEDLIQVQSRFPTADLSAYARYVNAKTAATNLLIAIDQALIAGNADEAQTQLDAYNAKDGEVVAAAAALPTNSPGVILVPYEAIASNLKVSYIAARDRAATADSIIRSYLGIAEMANSLSTNADIPSADGGAEENNVVKG